MTRSDPAPTASDAQVSEAMQAGRELGAAAVFFHARVAELLGLGPTDTKTLDLLGAHGQLTPKQLGELTGFTPAGITGIVDRLEKRHLVTRRDHPTDGRRVLIAMDPTAQQRLAPMYDGLATGLADFFATLAPEDLALVTHAFRTSAQIQSSAAANLTPLDDRDG